MTTVLMIVAAVVTLAVITILLLAMRKPDIFVVSRTTTIAASPEKIFPLIDDYQNWGQWSPYEKIDPNMKRTFSGASRGKGSIYEWTGNKNIGHGRMEILESSPSSRILIKLDFFTPFEAHNMAEFTLAPVPTGTDVTWQMRGPLPFMAKVMHTVFNVDRMVGNQFAEGLASMKAAAEK